MDSIEFLSCIQTVNIEGSKQVFYASTYHYEFQKRLPKQTRLKVNTKFASWFLQNGGKREEPAGEHTVDVYRTTEKVYIGDVIELVKNKKQLKYCSLRDMYITIKLFYVNLHKSPLSNHLRDHHFFMYDMYGELRNVVVNIDTFVGEVAVFAEEIQKGDILEKRTRLYFPEVWETM